MQDRLLFRTKNQLKNPLYVKKETFFALQVSLFLPQDQVYCAYRGPVSDISQRPHELFRRH